MNWAQAWFDQGTGCKVNERWQYEKELQTISYGSRGVGGSYLKVGKVDMSRA